MRKIEIACMWRVTSAVDVPDDYDLDALTAKEVLPDGVARSVARDFAAATAEDAHLAGWWVNRDYRV